MSLNNAFLEHPATQRLPKTEQEWIDFARVMASFTASPETIVIEIDSAVEEVQEDADAAQAAANAAQATATAAASAASTAQSAAEDAQDDADAAQATANTALAAANSVWVSGYIDDIAAITASGRVAMVAPCAGTITKIYVTINDVTSGGDAIVAMSINAVGITSGNVTVPDASVTGGIFSSTPSALNTVAEGDLLLAVSNGGGSSTCKAQVLMKITRT